MSLRLFIAVNLPEAERRAAFAATAALRQSPAPIKWVAEANLHITMRFLGAVEQEQGTVIGTALAQAVAKVKPFDVTLGTSPGTPPRQCGCDAAPDALVLLLTLTGLLFRRRTR